MAITITLDRKFFRRCAFYLSPILFVLNATLVFDFNFYTGRSIWFLPYGYRWPFFSLYAWDAALLIFLFMCVLLTVFITQARWFRSMTSVIKQAHCVLIPLLLFILVGEGYYFFVMFVMATVTIEMLPFKLAPYQFYPLMICGLYFVCLTIFWVRKAKRAKASAA